MRKRDRLLYQFPISHFCEKTRWQLDLKGLPYRVRNLPPVVHPYFLPGGHRTVPVLVDRGQTLGDSTAIALHLEERYPEVPLLPADPQKRARALALEDYFDGVVGPAVRRYMYSLALRTPNGPALVFFQHYPAPMRVLGLALSPRFERVLKRKFKIGDDDAVGEARAAVDAALDRIAREVDGDPGRRLTGALSIADIAGASLLAPLLGPPGTVWSSFPPPPDVAEARARARAHPAGQWALARYAFDRQFAPARARAA
jgi:glutathione S-transferase